MPRSHDKGPSSAAAAARIARRGTALSPSLAGRSQVLFAETRGAATRRDQEDPERVLLGVYDYERDRSVMAVVDTAGESVLAVDETEAQFQLSEEERHEAEHIAADDPQVRAYLAGRTMNPLTRLYFPPAVEGSPQHRHAIVFVRPTRSERRYAVVDLSARAVVEIIDRRQLAGE